MTIDGTVLDPAGIYIAASGGVPLVTATATDFLVAWASNTLSGTAITRVTAAGVVDVPDGIFYLGSAPQTPIRFASTIGSEAR